MCVIFICLFVSLIPNPFNNVFMPSDHDMTVNTQFWLNRLNYITEMNTLCQCGCDVFSNPAISILDKKWNILTDIIHRKQHYFLYIGASLIGSGWCIVGLVTAGTFLPTMAKVELLKFLEKDNKQYWSKRSEITMSQNISENSESNKYLDISVVEQSTMLRKEFDEVKEVVSKLERSLRNSKLSNIANH